MKPQNPEYPIQSYLSNQDLLNDTLEQLAKDLGGEGKAISDHTDGEGPMQYDKLIAELAIILEHLDGDNRLQSVLYRIDLPEKIKGRPTAWRSFKELAILVLDREFQKVWFRKWYTKHK